MEPAPASALETSAAQIALFDLDGTLAAYEDALQAQLRLLKAPQEPDCLPGAPRPPHIANRIRLIRSVPGWWLNLERLEAGFQLLEDARSLGFRIHVLSKGPYSNPIAWTEKLQWCQKHIGSDVEVTLSGDKGLVYGKVLVDDWPEYMLRWLEWRPRGLGIMPAQPWNEDFRHPNVIRYDGTNRAAVRERLIAARDRKPRENG